MSLKYVDIEKEKLEHLESMKNVLVASPMRDGRSSYEMRRRHMQFLMNHGPILPKFYILVMVTSIKLFWWKEIRTKLQKVYGRLIKLVGCGLRRKNGRSRNILFISNDGTH